MHWRTYMGTSHGNHKADCLKPPVWDRNYQVSNPERNFFSQFVNTESPNRYEFTIQVIDILNIKLNLPGGNYRSVCLYRGLYVYTVHFELHLYGSVDLNDDRTRALPCRKLFERKYQWSSLFVLSVLFLKKPNFFRLKNKSGFKRRDYYSFA